MSIYKSYARCIYMIALTAFYTAAGLNCEKKTPAKNTSDLEERIAALESRVSEPPANLYGQAHRWLSFSQKVTFDKQYNEVFTLRDPGGGFALINAHGNHPESKAVDVYTVYFNKESLGGDGSGKSAMHIEKKLGRGGDHSFTLRQSPDNPDRLEILRNHQMSNIIYVSIFYSSERPPLLNNDMIAK